MCIIHFSQKKWLECKIDKNASVTSTPTICQKFWKKKGVIPSGLEDLYGCI